MEPNDLALVHESMQLERQHTLGPGIVDRAARLGRQRRRRRRAAGSAVAALIASVVAIGLGTALTRHAGDTTAADGPHHTVDPSTPPTRQETFDWAASLPQSEAARPVVLHGRDLITATTTVRLPGTGASMVGVTVAGVMVNLEFDELDAGGTFSTHYALVSERGTIVDLPPNTGPTRLQDPAVSPDGTQIAYGSVVLNAESRGVVAAIPSDAVSLVSWTPAGIIYITDADEIYLWTPGAGQPTVLPENPGGYPSGTLAGFRNVHPCSDVVELSYDGAVRRTSDGCLDRSITSVSPDGASALDDDLDVIDVRSGSVTASNEKAPKDVFAYDPLVWTSDTHFVYVVTGRGADSTPETVVVQCATDDSRCVRLGDPLTGPGDTELATDLAVR